MKDRRGHKNEFKKKKLDNKWSVMSVVEHQNVLIFEKTFWYKGKIDYNLVKLELDSFFKSLGIKSIVFLNTPETDKHKTKHIRSYLTIEYYLKLNNNENFKNNLENYKYLSYIIDEMMLKLFNDELQK